MKKYTFLLYMIVYLPIFTKKFLLKAFKNVVVHLKNLNRFRKPISLLLNCNKCKATASITNISSKLCLLAHFIEIFAEFYLEVPFCSANFWSISRYKNKTSEWNNIVSKREIISYSVHCHTLSNLLLHITWRFETSLRSFSLWTLHY